MFVNITQHFSTAARQKAARMLGSFRVMVMLVAGLWFVEMADQMWRRSSPGHSLDVLGVYPRTVWGLAGILGAPFVHDGFGHLANNTLPLVVLGWLVMLGGRRLFFKVSGMIVGGGAGAGAAFRGEQFDLRLSWVFVGAWVSGAQCAVGVGVGDGGGFVHECAGRVTASGHGFWGWASGGICGRGVGWLAVVLHAEVAIFASAGGAAALKVIPLRLKWRAFFPWSR